MQSKITMNKIDKFLAKLNKKQRQRLAKIFADIRLLKVGQYDVKSLKGEKGFFRLRDGKIRIIYFADDSKGLLVIVGFRGSIY